MPFVHELRQRIQSLSEAISRQREVLKDLEQQYSAAQTELNASLDPMARLPFELSSDILRQSLLEPTTWESLMALIRVSRAWREVALAIPSLWTTISDQGIRPLAFPKLLDIWVARGQDSPFSLSLRHMSSAAFDNTFAALEKYANRVEKLDLWAGLGFRLPQTPFVALSSLTIDGDAEEKKWSFHVAAILGLLRNAPNLVEFNFLCPKLIPTSKVARVTHTNLRHLRLGRPEKVYSGSELLPHLELPSLETLKVSGHAEDLDELFHVSWPPLRTLHMHLGWTRDPLLFGVYVGPTLTDLEVTFPHTDESILTMLSNPDVLPELRHLVVRENVGGIKSWERNALTFLATPRPALKSVRLKVLKYYYDKFLSAEFVEAVRGYEGGSVSIFLESVE
ncbi:hypothetical protein FB45DRAFT_1067680 [Roridomyces roridus]|uniref:F-box domain-containing protein n=1 Tax=Roridomyces roridus TaxID=1738132 RepID=A0AAD7FA18_9AGAR|nr:hypothetical protein FB45DRAFT_1067680 [Roridomyces roridus]